MTNKEHQIHQDQIAARRILAKVTRSEVYNAIQEDAINTDRIVRVENYTLDIENATFTGCINFEYESHNEEDWKENYGACEVEVVDFVSNVVESFEGVIKVLIGKELAIKSLAG
jgi:hypothetical protein